MFHGCEYIGSICHSIPSSSLSIFLQFVTIYHTSELLLYFPLFLKSSIVIGENLYPQSLPRIVNLTKIGRTASKAFTQFGSISIRLVLKSHLVWFSATFQNNSVHRFHRFSSIFDWNQPMFYPTRTNGTWRNCKEQTTCCDLEGA